MLAHWQSKLVLGLTIGLFLSLGFAVYAYHSAPILAVAVLSVLVNVLAVHQMSAAAKSEKQARNELATRLQTESEFARERLEATARGLLESDISARKRAEESLGTLSARLLEVQDEERRRLARELHDSAGQLLAALSMKLTPLEAAFGESTAGPAIRESLDLVDQLSSELRTISHLLHPPLLDEAGLVSGLQAYLQGFTERSRIRASFECADDFGRLPRHVETAIFRVVQECLTNIHRHSGSSVAKVRLNRLGNMVRLEVADRGRGIPPEKRQAMDSVAFGVGIRGMRERIRQLGGNLEINSDGRGTVVVARLAVAGFPSAAVA